MRLWNSSGKFDAFVIYTSISFSGLIWFLMLLGEAFTVNSLAIISDCSKGGLQGNVCSQKGCWLTWNSFSDSSHFWRFLFFRNTWSGDAMYAFLLGVITVEWRCPTWLGLTNDATEKFLEDSSQRKHQNSTTTREPRLRWSRLSDKSRSRKKLLMTENCTPDNVHINFFNLRDPHRMQGFTLFHFRGVHDSLHVNDLILLAPHLLEGSPQVS